ncbi:hypothetical protein BUALT_Bualt03G0181700 [Buddleja alternifolia]|uniref:Uncharacterized protein n=1 Tax=Buddleja alternifolia TaxID=168488 RepID=A0AAV6Y2W0_9LAMI|nr:hypothetical protein BUALT_Bualt03G0181700 [Buddleja alternifolia]
MENYLLMKLKRKDLEDVNDDFSNFSLSSPVRKILRLDSELPPIFEDEECEIHVAFEQALTGEQRFGLLYHGFHLNSLLGTESSSQDDNSEMMDMQEVDEASMDVEDGHGIEQRNNVNEVLPRLELCGVGFSEEEI